MVISVAVFVLSMVVAFYVAYPDTMPWETDTTSIFCQDVIEDAVADYDVPSTAFDHYATQFIRGYHRMRNVCLTVASTQGWYTVSPGTGTDALSGALTGLARHPYFCINNLLSAYANDEIKTVRQREQMWRDVQRINDHLPGSDIDLATQVFELWRIKRIEHHSDASNAAFHPIEDLSTVVISQLGYLEDAMLARDIRAMGANYPRAVVRLLPYATFLQLNTALIAAVDADRGSVGSANCLCGPHMGAARSVVLSVSTDRGRAGARSLVFLEPVIVSAGKQMLEIQRADLPWNAHRSSDVIGRRLQDTDTALAAQLGLDAPLRYHAEVVVESIAMQLVDTSLKAEERRNVKHLSGNDALCVQYCHRLAYALRDSLPSDGSVHVSI